jgi:hypothetical protein
MLRVVGASDGRTLLVERGGAAVPIKLAGISIVDEPGAREMLRWTLASSWVLLDEQPNGEYLAYRSPDALFLNRELVLRGFAKATLPSVEPPSNVTVTYLGTMYAPAAPPARTRAASGNGNARSPRAPAKPSPPRRRRKP